ncbi:MAG: hypothetical protein HYZ23_06335 [Chloroflexi bacterium]|nr:hypothetical protein [Chloroflexota bacterium]
MRRGRTLIFVFLILIIGLAVAFVALRPILFPSTVTPPAPTTVDVYIAMQPIPQGGEIKAESLTTIKIAPENLVGVMFTPEEQSLLLGQVAKFPIDQGVVITESMVGSTSVQGSGPVWGSLIPAGMTAISIPMTVNEPINLQDSRYESVNFVGYGVSDGAHVNINACLWFVDIDPAFQTILPNQTAILTGTGFGGEENPIPILSLGVTAGGGAQGRLELDPSLQQPYYLLPSEPQRPRMVCQTIAQNVVVLHTGLFPLDPNAALSPLPPPNPDGTAAAPVYPTIVTLIVSPQDAVTLTYVMRTSGSLSLTLRNPTDELRQATEASTLQFLLSQYNIPVPAKLPYSLNPSP